MFCPAAKPALHCVYRGRAGECEHSRRFAENSCTQDSRAWRGDGQLCGGGKWRRLLNLSAPERIFIVRCSFCDAGNFAVTGIARMGSDLSQEDLWVQDLERNTSVRLTLFPELFTPRYGSRMGSTFCPWLRIKQTLGFTGFQSDGGGQPAQLASLRLAYPSSFAPDARNVSLRVR